MRARRSCVELRSTANIASVFTMNIVVHRRNLARLPQMIALVSDKRWTSSRSRTCNTLLVGRSVT